MIFDLVVLGIIIISAGLAFLRGFIREVLTIIGLLAGGAAAVALGPKLLPLTEHLLHVHPDGPVHRYFGILPAPVVAQILAYGSIFIVVALVFSIFSHFLSGAAKKVGLGPLNRTFGVLFGIARALLIVSLFYLLIFKSTTPADRDTWHWLAGSHARPYIEGIDTWLDSLLPASLIQKTEERFKQGAGSSLNNARLNDARAKLQELELLHRDPSQPPPMPSTNMPAVPVPPASKADETNSGDEDVPAAPAGGYPREQRQDMKNLLNTLHGNDR